MVDHTGFAPELECSRAHAEEGYILRPEVSSDGSTRYLTGPPVNVPGKYSVLHRGTRVPLPWQQLQQLAPAQPLVMPLDVHQLLLLLQSPSP